jgi:hypothetical protein
MKKRFFWRLSVVLVSAAASFMAFVLPSQASPAPEKCVSLATPAHPGSTQLKIVSTTCSRDKNAESPARIPATTVPLVTFYQNYNYNEDEIGLSDTVYGQFGNCDGAGYGFEDLSDVELAVGGVTSYRLFSNCNKALYYDQTGYSGNFTGHSGDNPNVGASFNDKIYSMTVRFGGWSAFRSSPHAATSYIARCHRVRHAVVCPSRLWDDYIVNPMRRAQKLPNKINDRSVKLAPDFPIYGLTGHVFTRRWADSIKGDRDKNLIGIKLGHTIPNGDSGVLVETLHRGRFDALSPTDQDFDRLTSVAAVGTEEIFNLTCAEPNFRIAGLSKVAMRYCLESARLHADWAQVNWTVGGSKFPASVWHFAGGWAGFTDQIPGVYVVATAINVAAADLAMTPVTDGKEYGLDIDKSITIDSIGGSTGGAQMPRPNVNQPHPDQVSLMADSWFCLFYAL